MTPDESLLLRVTNVTRNTVLTSRGQVADSFFKRFFGLMMRYGLPENGGLWIKPCNSIHSFWMRFVFDAVFMDDKGVVLHVIHRMKPRRISKMVKRARGVLELPEGVLEATGTRVGDQLQFEIGPAT